MWQSDASYFFMVGWGWYYSIGVLGDFSRFVLASDLKPDMTANPISDVVEQAVTFSGMRCEVSGAHYPLCPALAAMPNGRGALSTALPK